MPPSLCLGREGRGGDKGRRRRLSSNTHWRGAHCPQTRTCLDKEIGRWIAARRVVLWHTGKPVRLLSSTTAEVTARPKEANPARHASSGVMQAIIKSGPRARYVTKADWQKRPGHFISGKFGNCAVCLRSASKAIAQYHWRI